jgi:hypothetical protein
MLAVVEEKRVIPALSLTFQLFCGVQKFLPLAINQSESENCTA